MENRRIIRDMHCVSNKLSRQLDNLLSTQGITHMQFAILSFITRYTKDGTEKSGSLFRHQTFFSIKYFIPYGRKKINKKSIRQK